MGIKRIGTAPDGSAIFQMKGAGPKSTFSLPGKADFIKTANADWLGYLNAGPGSNTITTYSFIELVTANAGNDKINILGTKGYIKFLDTGGGNDVVTLKNGAGSQSIMTGGGADKLVMESNSNLQSIDMGDGRDVAILKGGSFLGTAVMGAGNDVLRVLGGSRVTFVDTRDGDDTVFVGPNASIGAVYARDGLDTITVNGGSIEHLQSFDASVVTVKGDGRLQSAFLGNGDDQVVLEDTARAYQLKLGQGTNTLTTNDGFVESVFSYNGTNTINIGSGGVEQISLAGDQGVQTITASGWAGSIQARGARADVDISGGAGQVRLRGDGGNTLDVLGGFVTGATMGAGNDTVTVTSGAGMISVTLREGDDTLINEGFVGLVYGFVGNDTIDTTAGDIDRAHLGDGNDTYLGSNGDGGDRANGGNGNDTLVGNAGVDILRGGADNDRITGGADDDILRGGAGADTFIYLGSDDDDVIADFEVGVDLIDVSALGIGFGDLTFTEADGVAVVSFGTSEIALTGLSQVELENAANFVFV